MQGINKTYLGWGNPRSAFLVQDHDIVVLTDAEKSCVLQGQSARDFRAELTDLSHHLCGVKSSAKAAKLLAEVPSDRHNLNVHNAIFDRHFKPDPELSKQMGDLQQSITEERVDEFENSLRDHMEEVKRKPLGDTGSLMQEVLAEMRNLADARGLDFDEIVDASRPKVEEGDTSLSM
ncbi:MAG: hypothetical protein ABJN42_13450 [Roseibium sp.]|uniref:hypothetical protein n=1 Tax=Roseibium sp. TaxID=1936156 RepID=UPI003298DAA2